MWEAAKSFWNTHGHSLDSGFAHHFQHLNISNSIGHVTAEKEWDMVLPCCSWYQNYHKQYQFWDTHDDAQCVLDLLNKLDCPYVRSVIPHPTPPETSKLFLILNIKDLVSFSYCDWKCHIMFSILDWKLLCELLVLHSEEKWD